MADRTEHEELRSAFGRVLTIGFGAAAALGVGLIGVSDGIVEAVQVLPWAAAAVVVCWAYFWRPRVEVTDGGVTLVNVTRSISIPWPALLDIDTQWAMRLVTAYGRYSAWAAPAPGMKSSVTSRRLTDVDDARTLGSPITPWQRGSMRPGDRPDTPSGDAAAMVRRRWAALREAGHLDDVVLERDRPTVRWHLDTLAVLVALAALGLLTARW